MNSSARFKLLYTVLDRPFVRAVDKANSRMPNDEPTADKAELAADYCVMRVIVERTVAVLF